MTLDDLSALGTFPALSGTVVRAERALAEAFARRLTTPRGALWYAPAYGTDLRQFVLRRDTPALRYAVEAAVEAELEKEGLVLEARAVVRAVAPRELTVTVEADTADGRWVGLVRATDALVEVSDAEPR